MISKYFRMSDSMLGYLPFEEKIMCLDSKEEKNEIKIIIGLNSGEIYLWSFSLMTLPNLDSSENYQLKLLKKHQDTVSMLSFNSNGSSMVSCSLDGGLSVINIETGMTIYERNHLNSLTYLNWTINNDMLLLGDIIGNLFVYNMITGEINLEKEIYNGIITNILISNNNKSIIISGEHFKESYITIWTIK